MARGGPGRAEARGARERVRPRSPAHAGTRRRAPDEHFSMEQVNSLREVQALRRLSLHPNTVTLHEVFLFLALSLLICFFSDKQDGSLSPISELLDMNIYELIKGSRKPLPEKIIKIYIYQLCKSLDYIYRKGIFHRDMKAENIVIKQNTSKLGDFGSCKSVYSKPHTEYISTRWYQAWECLLTESYYSYKIDMWSAGCVFYEITSFQPLFPGSNELDQISNIHDVIGIPANKTQEKFKPSRIQSFDFPFKKGKEIPPLVQNLSHKDFSLLYAMIKYDPDERTAAHEALQHPYFQELWEADTQALAMHKKLLGNVSRQVPLHLRQISKESQRQYSLRKVQEKAKQQHGPPHGELLK
ncbi:LOW QUALITY PROTEIN: MAPK/MAK/MRK overlapping kinase [Aegotheles albertisi]